MDQNSGGRPLAVVTGASVGIGFELAQVPPITSMSQSHPTRRAYTTLPQIFEARGANVVAIEA